MVLLMLLSLGTIYLISARAGFAIVILIGFIVSILSFKWSLKFVFAMFSMLFIVSILFFYNSNLKKRFSESFTYEPRTAIWPCAIKAILHKPSTILMGYGSEIIAQEKLNACYIETSKTDIKWFWFYDTKLNVTYNTHNVYLEYWIAFGLIALFFLLLFLSIPIIASIHFNHTLLFSLTLFIALNFIFENYLSRQVGIYTSIMILSLLLREESLITLRNNNDDHL
jgi:O-antigen ligase